MVNITTPQVVAESGTTFLKNILGFSGWAVQRLSEVIPLKQTQMTALVVLIDLILIWIAITKIAKPLIQIVIIVLGIWVFAGFFIG